MQRSGARLFIVLAVVLASGRATTRDRAWGEDATWSPGWERVRAAAVDSARDPNVWVPLAGAAVFQIGDWDHEVAEWARRETPVFGSAENAAEWSDRLKSASAWSYALTVLLAPGGDKAGEWFEDKAGGLAVGLSAPVLTSWSTQALKSSVGRERPDGSDHLSFPSGHTSASAVNSKLASRNLRSFDLSDGERRAFDIGLLSLTLGTSWARIEAGKHYPSDTLFGMALGHWFASFINDAFLGINAHGDRHGLMSEAVPDGFGIRYVAYD